MCGALKRAVLGAAMLLGASLPSYGGVIVDQATPFSHAFDTTSIAPRISVAITPFTVSGLGLGERFEARLLTPSGTNALLAFFNGPTAAEPGSIPLVTTALINFESGVFVLSVTAGTAATSFSLDGYRLNLLDSQDETIVLGSVSGPSSGAVPVPASVALLAAGGLGLFGAMRRRGSD